MPLKHDVETWLVILLAGMIALAGIAVTFLPPLSVQAFPWVVAFVISVLYPLALYPMLKERRAEYEFRALHFVPMLILLVWMALDLLASFRPEFAYLQEWYTWAWALPVVAAAFVLLMFFCLLVIRQRGARIVTLLLLLAPFIIFSQWSERSEWDRKLAAVFWNGQQTGTGIIASGNTSSNLAPSDNKEEEKWRMQLRRMERRSQRIEQDQQSGAISVRGASDGVVIASGGTPRIPAASGSSSSAPPVLPSSGFGSEGVMLVMVAGYCATIHRRAIRI